MSQTPLPANGLDNAKKADQWRQLEQDFRALVENNPDIVARLDREFRHCYINRAIEKTTGIPPELFQGKTNRELEMPAALCDQWETALREVFLTGNEQWIEFAFPAPNGTRHYQARLVPEFGDDGAVESVLAVTRDITEQKQAEEDRESLIRQLQEALATVKTLRELLPICAWCKKIRNDQGYWHQLEAYLQEHLDLTFTHGICPVCLVKVENETPTHPCI